MNKITEPLQTYLAAHNCAADLDATTNVLHFGIDGANARWRCIATEDDASRFVCVSLIPLVAQERRRRACAELIARVNGRLGLGHFDVDFNDGELRFLTSVPFSKEETLSPEVMEQVVGAHHTIVDAFIPAIASVIFAGMPPATAIDLDLAKAVGSAESRFSLN